MGFLNKDMKIGFLRVDPLTLLQQHFTERYPGQENPPIFNIPQNESVMQFMMDVCLPLLGELLGIYELESYTLTGVPTNPSIGYHLITLKYRGNYLEITKEISEKLDEIFRTYRLFNPEPEGITYWKQYYNKLYITMTAFSKE